MKFQDAMYEKRYYTFGLAFPSWHQVTDIHLVLGADGIRTYNQEPWLSHDS